MKRIVLAAAIAAATILPAVPAHAYDSSNPNDFVRLAYCHTFADAVPYQRPPARDCKDFWWLYPPYRG